MVGISEALVELSIVSSALVVVFFVTSALSLYMEIPLLHLHRPHKVVPTI